MGSEGGKSRVVKFLIGVCILLGASFGGTLHAYQITLDDTHNYWPGWGNGSGDDDKDVIGIPNITKAKIKTNNKSNLKKVVFFFETWKSGGAWDMLYPGDLFISTDSDPDWEYVIASGEIETYSDSGSGGSGFHAGTEYEWNIYEVDIPLNPSEDEISNYYALSGKDRSGYWSRYYIRDNHPVGVASSYIEDLTRVGTAKVKLKKGKNKLMFKINYPNKVGISFAGDWGIGWGPNCANDAFHYHTPEPASMLLLGTGLVGLAGYARKRKKQS